MSRTRLVSALVAACFVVAAGSAALADDAKCQDAVAKGSRNVGNQEQKKNRKCVKDGSGDISGCVTPEGAKAAIKRTKLQDLYAVGGKCDPVPAVGVNPLPNDIADDTEDAAGDIIRGIFGDPPDGVVAADKCSDKMAKRAGKKFDTELKAFRSCIKDAAPLANQAAVDACITTGVNDPKAQTTVQPKLQDDMDAQCAAFPPAGTEDGACAGCSDAASCATCIGNIVDCQACLAMKNSNNGNANCDMLDDGLANGSCGAVCGNMVAEGSEQCDGADLGVCPGGATCSGSCQCVPGSCANIDANGANANASGTFTVTSAGAPQAGNKYCGGTSAANAFGPCVTDADCGASVGQCVAIPWLGVAVFAPFPITGISTTFTAGPPDAQCVHQATIPCVGSTDPCPGTPKLGAGNPCCTTPGFTVGTFLISALGFCSRVDQTACGGGVVDTSVPMLGDNDVSKVADTTTPTNMGTCSYNGTEVHPACMATEDALGTIATTIGNGSFDAAGGHSRFTIPQRSVTWIEGAVPAPCNPASLFDETDTIVSNFQLQLATTTASSSAAFVDTAADNDAIDFCGFGPAAFNGIAVGAPDLPGQGSRTVAVGAALSGGGPTYDLLFSSITPLTSPVLVAPIAACVPAAPGCPE